MLTVIAAKQKFHAMKSGRGRMQIVHSRLVWTGPHRKSVMFNRQLQNLSLTVC